MRHMKLRFDEAYEVWFAKHLAESSGDRRDQLLRRRNQEKESGEDGAEKLFLRKLYWPLKGSLDKLIPEFEVIDGAGKVRFLDHAEVQYPKLLDYEVEGYGPHQKEASRWTFADDRRRTAALRLLGWESFHIAYSDIVQNPLASQQLLKRWLAQFEPKPQEVAWTEHLMRLALYHGEFTLGDVCRVLGVSAQPAREFIRKLISEGKVIAHSNGVKRIHCYKVSEECLRAAASEKIEFR